MLFNILRKYFSDHEINSSSSCGMSGPVDEDLGGDLFSCFTLEIVIVLEDIIRILLILSNLFGKLAANFWKTSFDALVVDVFRGVLIILVGLAPFLTPGIRSLALDGRYL